MSARDGIPSLLQAISRSQPTGGSVRTGHNGQAAHLATLAGLSSVRRHVVRSAVLQGRHRTAAPPSARAA